jgi:hypothetical protein
MMATTTQVDSTERPVDEVSLLDRGVEIQKVLSEIFQSVPFKSSKQSQLLLQYIVEQSLIGHTDLLRERIIGTKVFARRPDYDTNEDPVVRTRAGEVRKRLAQYYLGEGSQSTLRIEIAVGSYHATFIESSRQPPHHEAPPSVLPVPLQATADEGNSASGEVNVAHALPRSVTRWRWSLTAAVILLASIGAGMLLLWPKKPIDVFWEPLLDAKKPVLIYSGANAAYRLAPEFTDRYKATHPAVTLQVKDRELVIPLASDTKIGPGDLVPLQNEFVTLGDLSANVRVAALLAMHNRSFDLRSGEDVAIGDLRESPTLLIGSFDLGWRSGLTGNPPFNTGPGHTIRDQADPSHLWSPSYSKDGKVAVDYAIVTRLPRSQAGQPLIMINGTLNYGTRAAGDFITSPQLIRSFLDKAPKNWATKNLQFVIRTTVVNEVPMALEVVAARYW